MFVSLLKKTGLSVITLVIAFGMLEVFFRVMDLRGYHAPRTREWASALRDPEDMTPGVWMQFKPHSQFVFRYDSNPRGYFDDNQGLTYHLNNYGFRGGDFMLAKWPEVKRIMILGDSFTFGEGVRLEDTFAWRLEDLLRNRTGGLVEVLNCGVSGWSTADEMNYLRWEGVQFKPDLVLLVYVLNDISSKGSLDVFQEFINSYQEKARSRSYVLSFLMMKRAQQQYLRNYVQSIVNDSYNRMHLWDNSLALLSTCKRLAEASGARFAVAIFPFMYDLSDDCPFKDLHAMVYERCVTNEVDVLDLLPAFIGNQYTDLWVHPSDPHPNEKGHEIAANELAEFIISNDLLGPTASSGKGVNRF